MEGRIAKYMIVRQREEIEALAWQNGYGTHWTSRINDNEFVYIFDTKELAEKKLNAICCSEAKIQEVLDRLVK